MLVRFEEAVVSRIGYETVMEAYYLTLSVQGLKWYTDRRRMMPYLGKRVYAPGAFTTRSVGLGQMMFVI